MRCPAAPLCASPVEMEPDRDWYRQVGAAPIKVPYRANLITLHVRRSCTIKVGVLVPTDTTYTHLRENLAGILDDVIDQQEVVIVRRKGARGRWL